MDFGSTAAQLERERSIREFVAQHLPRRDDEPTFTREDWLALGKFGLLGLCIPEEHGGLGLGALDTARAIEALGQGGADMGLVFSAAAHQFACSVPLWVNGTPEQRARWLPKLCSGEWIGANAMTEPEAGSDVSSLRSTAKKEADGSYVLDADKTYVTNGPVADVILFYATTDPSSGYFGLSAFVIERGTPGLTIGKPIAKAGLARSPMCSVYLQGCRVPAENRVGPENRGAAVFKSSMLWERACLFAAYVGSLQAQLDACVRHARTRRQFKKRIGKFQAVSHRIANMRMRLEAARLLLYKACWMRDAGQDATAAIAMAKVAVSEAAITSGIDAIMIHGGMGIASESHVDEWLRDALPASIFSGTNDIQRNLIASDLGL